LRDAIGDGKQSCLDIKFQHVAYPYVEAYQGCRIPRGFSSLRKVWQRLCFISDVGLGASPPRSLYDDITKSLGINLAAVSHGERSNARSKVSSEQCDLRDIALGANEAGLDDCFRTCPSQLTRCKRFQHLIHTRSSIHVAWSYH
jgi:hypothetical protein